MNVLLFYSISFCVGNNMPAGYPVLIDGWSLGMFTRVEVGLSYDVTYKRKEIFSAN